MARPPHRPPALRGRFFDGPAAVAAGLITRTQLQGKAWRRLVRGVYADALLPVTHELRCQAVAAHLLPDGGAIAGRSAATLLGPGLARPVEPVEVIAPEAGRPRVRDVIAHAGHLDPAERCLIRGIPVTTPLRTCWDLTQWLDPIEAVVLLDRIVRAGLVTEATLSAHAAARRGTYGSVRFAQTVALVNGRAESPQESRLRVMMVLAGLPMPQVQWKIYDAAGFIARVDLAYPELRVAIEYDGVWHASADQLNNDRDRLNRLQAAGWLVIHVTAARLYTPEPLLHEITGALATRRPR